jgi:D-psicose/D-tagatose/L-ribulose 3-epimerase
MPRSGLRVAPGLCQMRADFVPRYVPGCVHFAETFAALEEIGYDGTITFESFSSAVVSPALPHALCIWRETWDDSMELATSARRFVLEQRAAATA